MCFIYCTVLFLLFCFTSTVVNGCSNPDHHHHPLKILSPFPRRSDVLLTSRAPHTSLPFPTGVGPGSGKYSTWDAAKMFHATRLDWVYTLNSTFVSEAKSILHNLSIISTAMNPQTPDANGKTFKNTEKCQNYSRNDRGKILSRMSVVS